MFALAPSNPSRCGLEGRQSLTPAIFAKPKRTCLTSRLRKRKGNLPLGDSRLLHRQSLFSGFKLGSFFHLDRPSFPGGGSHALPQRHTALSVIGDAPVLMEVTNPSTSRQDVPVRYSTAPLHRVSGLVP